MDEPEQKHLKYSNHLKNKVLILYEVHTISSQDVSPGKN